jgi:hypothetical protein
MNMASKTSVTILVYYGRYEDEYWLADTPAQKEASLRRLFKFLDDLGCYVDDEDFIQEARAGSIHAITQILKIHNRREYESWDFLTVWEG